MLGPGLEREKVCLRSTVGTRGEREACKGSEHVRIRGRGREEKGKEW